MRMLVANPIAMTGVLNRSRVRVAWIGCSMRWKLTAASAVAVVAAIANISTGFGSWPCATMTMTGQCHR